MDLRTLQNVAPVLDACQRGARVAMLTDNGDVRNGTARSVGDDRGNFAHGDADALSVFVRVTWADGFDSFLPMGEVADKYAAGTFVLDYTA